MTDCGIPYKKFFKIPKKPLFVTFCMGNYKSLTAIPTMASPPLLLGRIALGKNCRGRIVWGRVDAGRTDSNSI
jgi:hypothetical protein